MNEPVDPDRQLVDSYSASRLRRPERAGAPPGDPRSTCAHDLREGPRRPARVRVPGPRRPRAPRDELLPASAPPPRRRELPEVSEREIVRHYVNLSKRNFDLDSGFYPLGSCTMKYNPRLHERVTALPGHARCTRCRTPSARRARSS
jgi:hypothetical protein